MNPRFVAFLMLNNGKQWKSKQARNASYICFIIDMKVKYRRAYQSRHTYACWSLTAGANPNFIASQMGHTNAQMVYQVYGAWMSDNNADQIAILNQKLSDFAPPMPQAVGS